MRWSLGVLIAVVAACGAKTTTSAAAPAKAPVEFDSTVTIRIPQDTLPGQVSPELEKQLQDQLDASRRASMSAASITVRVDTVRLAIGGEKSFRDPGIVARDSAGNVIENYAPSLRIEDRTIVTLQGPNLLGLTTGVTALVIGARTEDPATNEVWMRDLARVTIIVGMSQFVRPRRPPFPKRTACIPLELNGKALGHE